MDERGNKEETTHLQSNSSNDDSSEKSDAENKNNEGSPDTPQDEVSIDEKGGDGDFSTMVEETSIQMLINSAGEGEYLFISWEPGRRDQFYFLTTKARVRRSEEWLESTMNILLPQYGLKNA